MNQRPISVMALAAIALGLFATLLAPSSTDFPPSIVEGPSRSAPASSSQPSILLSWLNPILDTAKLLHEELQMPGDLALEVAASIHRRTQATGIAPELVVALIKVESGGKPHAVSPKQAVGLMQVRHPVWGETLGVSYEELFDIDTNIRAGVHILRHYMERHETLGAALAAYSGNPHSKGYPKKVLAAFHEFLREI